MEGLWDYSPQWNVNGSDVCHFWVQAFKEVHVLFAFSFPFCQLDARNSNNLGWGSATWAQGLSMKFYWNTATLIRLHMAYSSFSATTRSWVDCNRNRAINLKYLLCVCVCVFRHVRLCNPMDYSLPVSSVHGIFQARILEWVAISSSRASSRPRNWTRISYVYLIAGGFLTLHHLGLGYLLLSS